MVTRAPAGMPGQFSFDAFLNRRRAKKYQAVFASLAVGALAATWMQCCPDCERYLDRACRGSVASMRLNANGGCRSRSGSLCTNPDFDRLRCLPPLPRLRGRSEINPAAKSFDGLYRPVRKHANRSMES